MYGDQSRLIREVRLRPAIYDAAHPRYKDQAARDMLWAEVAAAVDLPVLHVTGTGDCEAAGGHVPAETCRQRWKNLRDSYRKEKQYQQQGASGASKRKRRYPWVHARAMAFLDGVTQAPCPSPARFLFQEHLVVGEGPGVDVVDCKPARSPEAASPTGAKCVQQQALGTPSVHSDVVEDVGNTYDEDLHFCMSLLGPLRRLGNERKLGTKIKIYQLLAREEFGHLNFQ